MCVYVGCIYIGYHSHQAQGYLQYVCTACLLKMYPEYQDRLSENDTHHLPDQQGGGVFVPAVKDEITWNKKHFLLT